ncbi:hypothetical protein WH52_09675 [Tenacibaculum holothuriorum]|uniref:HmuY protein n=1 Tax=Tenacibaculum holothuriorum TaxID=1635173 RepID=A0A1Y2PBZ0_9FLAO|nr:HmuY family protein [Tenacibaculum holothuriorum]OSY87690.1 hypothetical protein WH52_09675 [Tenacibaculum holothuriorum]
MKNFKSILTAIIIAFVFTSCSDNEKPVIKPVASQTIENLAAPASGHGGKYTGAFAKFSFKEGKVVTGDNWDIAFRATEIIVNGGEKGKVLEDIDRTGQASLAIVNGTFASVKEVPTNASFKQDTTTALAIPTGSNNGWYSYAGPPTHAINPIAGKVIVVKTIEGNYVKMEILSYYKDKDASNPANGRHYTFNYVYNPNVGDKSFQ